MHFSTTSFQETVKLILFNRFKTNNPILDTIIMTIGIWLFGKLLLYYEMYNNYTYHDIYTSIVNTIYKPHKIIICGTNVTTPCPYGELYKASAYSVRFCAVLDYIVANYNESVHEIKELFSNYSNNALQNQDNYVVCQTDKFSIDNDIFFRILNENDTHENANKVNSKIEKISIEIFSYTYSTKQLMDYVENIVFTYRKRIFEDRKTKQFIYTAVKCNVSEDECKYNIWDEQVFTSNRTFDNLFLKDKDKLINQVDFFLNNKEWYDNRGIPYNLGIGLHGPPGTGKTSFIKALTNKTKRDIVVIPLKIIQTKTELNRLFYETTYHSQNTKLSKTFDKKIIVFEDIDCIGDIVKNREKLFQYRSPPNLAIETIQNAEETPEKKILTSINKTLDSSLNTSQCLDMKTYCMDPLTLDDFLNLWDGIQETPGRIIVITSNHYDKLDPALIRPGRIDLSYEFANVCHIVLQEMHQCFYGKQIEADVLKQIPEYIHSPAKIMNRFMINRENENMYLKSLSK